MDSTDPHIRVLIAKVGLETLHIRVQQETPADKLALQGKHFGVLGVDEFNRNDAEGFQQMEGIMGVVGGVAGEGAVDNLKTIISVGGRRPRETMMQTKVRMLPIIGNPREVSRRAIVMTWPVREDPVVRNRLAAIMEDGRFDKEVRDTAKRVLEGTIDETERAAVGVD